MKIKVYFSVLICYNIIKMNEADGQKVKKEEDREMKKVIHDGHRLNTKTTCRQDTKKVEYSNDPKLINCPKCIRIMKTRTPSTGLLGKRFKA